MNFPSSSLLFPLTFKNFSGLIENQDVDKGLQDISFSQNRVCVMKSWGSMCETADSDEADRQLAGGVVAGSQDGTIYLFTTQQGDKFVEPSIEPALSNTPSRLSSPVQAPSPTSLPSFSSFLAFNMTPRARVVSGISIEQVEAPKNYVDFEDEPLKLKEMLKGRYPKDRERLNVSDDGSDRGFSREQSPTPSLLASSTAKRKLALKSSSTSHSSAPSSASFLPISMHTKVPHPLTLWCRIIPPRLGGRAVITGICLLERVELTAILQETGNIYIVSLRDGACLASISERETVLRPPTGVKNGGSSHELWSWNRLEQYYLGETTILLASAAVDRNSPSYSSINSEDGGDKSRLALYELCTTDQVGTIEISLAKIGQWSYDGVPHCVGLHRSSNENTTFFVITPHGHFVIRSFQIVPRAPDLMEEQSHDPTTKNPTSIPLPNPFKGLRSKDQSNMEDSKGNGRIVLDEEHDLGNILPGGSPTGFRVCDDDKTMFAAAWSENEMTIFEYHLGVLHVLCIEIFEGIRDVQLSKSTITILFKDRAEHYTILPIEPEHDFSDTASTSDRTLVKLERFQEIVLDQHDAAEIVSASHILTSSLVAGRHKLIYWEPEKSQMLWEVNDEAIESPGVTSLLPLDLDVIIAGYGDGHLQQLSLLEMLRAVDKPQQMKSTAALNGFVTSLHIVHNPETEAKFIAGGADDGSIAFWTVDSQFKLCARWTVFVTPLMTIVSIPDIQEGPLKGCILCISEDGTIAVIAIGGFQLLFLIPGSMAPLERGCISGDNILLIYADRRARLWDVRTQEFWRSMSLEKVNELLDQGGWTNLSFEDNTSLPDIALHRICGVLGPDASTTLILDLERYVAESALVLKTATAKRDATRHVLPALERLRSLLSVLVTPGLSTEIDNICSTKLSLPQVQISAGSVSCSSVTLYQFTDSSMIWCLSADISAARALSVIVILDHFGLYEEYIEAANTLTVFYATSLADCIGPNFKAPSLVYLAQHWFDGSSEVGKAARTLFDYSVACLPDEESVATVEHWQHYLPCLQPTAEQESRNASLALFLCGYLSAEKYSMLRTSTLTDVSKSIALYLHDEKSMFRVLAVDLCSRGFHVWQHYIDAMEILRSLFVLATTSRKDSINLQNVGSQARLAVLQIASGHTGLFMTTLALDIHNPPNLEHRKCVLQIVAYLIRKRPLVLQPNIPKLMEAVVKSLDPTDTTHREAVFDTATEIIGYVVKTFPSVDFHMTTQRLAVGTNEGAVVMYDVKTAIRLYVLEGHKKAISTLSFSPDGRRLVTLSLEESVILVWKVGSSFVSLFYPGAPPRQGHSGSAPFKTISFNVGDEEHSSVQDVVGSVCVEWTGDRSVKLKVRETVMSFST